MASLKERCHRLEALERHRDTQRAKLDELNKQKTDLEQEISSLSVVLETLDTQIDELESGIVAEQNPVQQQLQQQKRDEEGQNSHEQAVGAASRSQHNQSSQVVLSASPLPSHHGTMSMQLPEETLTDPSTPRRQPQGMVNNSNIEPSQIIEDDDDIVPTNNSYATARRPSSSNSSSSNTGSLQIVTVAPSRKKRPRVSDEATTHSRDAVAASTNTASAPNGTLDAFFKPRQPVTSAAAPAAAAASANNNQHRPLQNSVNDKYNRNDFPWSQQVLDLLQKAFRIPSFREHQREVINCTLNGDDVFVLMRTGGGKSLTYQLPALLEGRPPNGQPGKITFVISPLLSLIKDQEDQMNQFAPNSALSFTSGLPGGYSEHSRRWNMVHDPSQGICLVFVTPEKVFKSGKLKSQIQKLYNCNRLGRFVVDEAHCCSSWGHDFRPDYTKLGLLRDNFKGIPIIAVTATASDRVRHDVCDILRMSHSHRFFRSTANRPNLTYEIRVKQASGGAVLDDMAALIKEEFLNKAGIIYTLSRKDADTVADELGERGIVARSYHSDVTPAQKDMIHQSWMRNDTQVVVATIAFGLGINKPDVRFVLHHTISKTLEAYYQESGRAGRDGKPAKCVLYYSPKDVPRMVKMVHQDSQGKIEAFWQMIRYAQASFGDKGCRAMILQAMGEGSAEIERTIETETRLQLQCDPACSGERRDVGSHAKTVAQVLQLHYGENITQAQLVKEWRQKPATAPQCVQDNPPGKDLNIEECERVVVLLLEQGIFALNFHWTAYDCVPYVQMGERGRNLLNSPHPKVVMAFPKREKAPRKSDTRGDRKKTKARKAVPNEDGFFDRKTKAPAKKTKKSANKATGTRKKKKPNPTEGTSKIKSKTARKAEAKQSATTDVIELSSSDEELVVDLPVTRQKSAHSDSASPAALKDVLMDDSEASEPEHEFDG